MRTGPLGFGLQPVNNQLSWEISLGAGRCRGRDTSMKMSGMTSRAEVRAAGSVSAGEFVEIIHDGIDFSLSRLESEIFELLKRSLGLTSEELHELARSWGICARRANLGIDARRMFQLARTLGISTPTMDAALGLRSLSAFEKENDFVTTLHRQPRGKPNDARPGILNELYGALRAASLITIAEGMAVLTAGSESFGLGLGWRETLCSWRDCGGWRQAIFSQIANAVQATDTPSNLLDDDDLSDMVMSQQEWLRHAVWRAVKLQTPVPALMASLDYLDSFRGAWLPVNLIQKPVKISSLGGDALRALTAVNEEQHGHAHGQTVGDLVDDQGSHRIGSFAVNFDPPVNRPRVHDQGFGFGPGQAGPG